MSQNEELTNSQKNWRNVMQPKCPKCGEILNYNANTHRYYCGYCDKKYNNPEDSYKTEENNYKPWTSLVEIIKIAYLIFTLLLFGGLFYLTKDIYIASFYCVIVSSVFLVLSVIIRLLAKIVTSLCRETFPLCLKRSGIDVTFVIILVICLFIETNNFGSDNNSQVAIAGIDSSIIDNYSYEDDIKETQTEPASLTASKSELKYSEDKVPFSGRSETEGNSSNSLKDTRKPDYSKFDFEKTEFRTYTYKSYNKMALKTINYDAFPVGVAEYYKTLDRYSDISDWKHYLDDEYNKKICQTLSDACFLNSSNSDFEAVTNAISFVQSLSYIPDEKGEYPKYPIETLYDNGGDCEDKSLFLCGLVRSMGYGVVLLIYDNHCAVGIAGDNLDGSYFEHDGKKYFYIETPQEGWTLGKIPDEFRNKSAKLIVIN